MPQDDYMFGMCPSCGQAQGYRHSKFVSYFERFEVPCDSCKEGLDWWKLLRTGIVEHFMLTGAFKAIGATETITVFSLRSASYHSIDLVKLGIPEDSHVLSVNYTGGRVRPVEVHGNVPRQRTSRRILHLYGIPDEHGTPDSETCAAITWMEPQLPEREQLVQAVREYDAGRFDAVVVPANVSVESMVAIACRRWVGGFCSGTNGDEFLRAASYSHQLNVLLPVIAQMVGFPPLGDEVRGLLNRLRNERNSVAHRGQARSNLDKAEVGTLLAAAVFGLHYATEIDVLLAKAQESGALPAAPNAGKRTLRPATMAK